MKGRKRYRRNITPEEAEFRFVWNFCARQGYDIETAERIASSDPELKEDLDTVKEIAKRTSIRYRRCNNE